MTNRKAPESVMRDLCEAADKYCGSAIIDGLPESSRPFFRAVAAYRAATAPLRTRASVDAEIVVAVRKDRCGSARGIGCAQSTLIALDRLCSEPTADEKIRAQRAECEWCQDTSQPQLHQHRIPEHVVRVCRRCLDEREIEPTADEPTTLQDWSRKPGRLEDL